MDRSCGVHGLILIATENGLPDDVDLEIVVGEGADEVLRLTGAEQASRSYRVDEQNEPRAAGIGVEGRLELLDSLVGGDFTHVAGFLSEQVGLEPRHGNPDPWRLSR